MDPKDWISLAMFILAMIGAAGTYFKTMSDMRHETQTQFSEFGEKIRREIREQYATKEETRFQHDTLDEIKQQLRDLNQKLELKRLV